ncbi:acetylglutamate kinase [Ehrlichia ruminantium]|uniref:Acetylglutamate kinase n=2 Tax=Ehrlichia ruminantium TaxID=779 RepID=ARGB_EHRRG|nr:acetylglutamate kinase [Ehrlichia ruminantium]Q5FGU6.1 RecName: Full=Acetylglutamate kinase; AltName: Full=N-acetyl-L-glutamate 5-phosphotransferase; AltName: Full=NAG kinase; Short=NAGK [Ehrlichia ruminantium str. Gardel]KYW90250.1 acetylglutamate kinase [Ehrlichia ruminantium]QLK50525.1 acetylglutamate kinase [Ehrlichia ruminantium]QLK51450.1 acetylglutamate kinase [Ehrlichia ruminantium]QLK52374.1 acetylglutamate kinase [Ehrlichia ruminantium]QLK53285.1 acetylglutamate kinase [Ehrlichia
MKLRNVSKNNLNKEDTKLSIEQFGGNVEWFNITKTLSESLPYIQQFSGETFIIKYGGAAMTDKKLAESFAHDVVLLKQLGINPIVVHGGGNKINEFLEKINKKSTFINGLRITDAETLEIVEMVLCGLVNKNITQLINNAGGNAIGLCGKDANLIEAKKICYTYKENQSNNVEKILDMGFVGEPHDINTDLLFFMEESDFIPVIAPVCSGENNLTYNVNADLVAGALANAMAAAKLIILTNVSGVTDSNGNLISELSVSHAENLIDNGTAHTGMIPKLQTCVKVVKEGYGSAHIIDGRIPHVLLLELFTIHGTGTMVVNSGV